MSSSETKATSVQFSSKKSGVNYSFYVGVILALLGSGLCALLLVVHSFSWFQIVHADFSYLEDVVIPQYIHPNQLYFQTVALAWALGPWLLSSLWSPKAPEGTVPFRNRKKEKRRLRTTLCMGILLILPYALEPFRSAHPIIRRSLIAKQTSQPPSVDASEANRIAEGDVANENQDATEENKPVRTVDLVVENMTCGGCGSYVRNLIESYDKSIENAHVDWPTGHVTVFGDSLQDLDLEGLSQRLATEGYPMTVWES